MGFLQPAPPPVDVEEWKRLPYLERLKPLVQDWGVNGFGTPWGVYLLYALKLVIFATGGLAIIGATTPGLGGLGSIGDWWTEPIVFQKAVLWLVIWEAFGFGAGSMPLTLRFVPPFGGFLYWLRPGTVRQPPWPDRVPLTAGDTRTVVDVALYVGLLGLAGYMLVDGESADAAAGTLLLDRGLIAALLGVWALLGLRDKVSCLAGRPEVYGFLLVVFLFPFENLIVASQFVLYFIWLGAASSKLNRHFPFVVSVMISNTPWNRSRRAKAKLYKDHPTDMRPSGYAALAAHTGTAMEFTLPLALLLSSGGVIGTIAVVGMIIFHVHITSTFPLAVPLEWNLFMIFGILFLFGEYGDVPLSTLDDPLLIALLAIVGLAIPVFGNLRPDWVSFLPSMRYYAGNWATSQWLFRRDTRTEERLDECVTKVSAAPVEQLVSIYEDRDLAEILLAKGIAFRSMHSHGRALNALALRAVDDIEQYSVREGELISGIVNGWNFGDGHFHDHRLLESIQRRCGFEPGELRVVTLESQPFHRPHQRYRIYDAADGLLEEGLVNVREMVQHQPWLGDGELALQVTSAPGDTDVVPESSGPAVRA